MEDRKAAKYEKSMTAAHMGCEIIVGLHHVFEMQSLRGSTHAKYGLKEQ